MGSSEEGSQGVGSAVRRAPRGYLAGWEAVRRVLREWTLDSAVRSVPRDWIVQ